MTQTQLLPAPQAHENKCNLFYGDMPVRIVIDEHGEPWFIARDVCDILEIRNVTGALRSLDEDELTLLKSRAGGLESRSGGQLDDELLSLKVTSGGQLREMNAISESGLYTLLIRSNKPQAKPFRRWVTHEVLTSIRKTGGYVHAAAQGLPAPELVQDVFSRLESIDRKINQFMVSSNTYGTVWAFVHERCTVGHAHVAEKDALYAEYVRYCAEKNAHVELRNPFFARLYRAVPVCYSSKMTRAGHRSHVVRGIGVARVEGAAA